MKTERTSILKSARAYFEENFKSPAFVPGETYIPVTTKVMDADDMSNLIDASLDMWLTTGRFAREFESVLPLRFRRKAPALLVNSGSSANLLALSSLGSPMLRQYDLEPLQPGDEVITAAAGFPTTVNPIIQNGWVPVFVDVEMKTLNATLDSIERAKSPKTRAVILAHTLGNPYRADKIASFCEREKLFFIEDCCDALGASIHTPGVGERPAGSFSDYSTLSFYPAHHITMGEGGAVVSRDSRLKRVAESMRDWGRDCWCDPGKDNTCGKRFEWQLGDLPFGYDHKYIYSSVGYNLKVTDMQAAVGLSQLNKLDSFVEARRKNWRTLYDGVNSSPLLKEMLIPVEPTPGTQPSWFGFPVHCAERLDRQQLTSLLEERKVGTRLLFGGNLTKQPAYRGVPYRLGGTLDNADRIMRQTFWIGVHPALDEARLSYMLETLEDIIKALR